jgi:ligand-binding SRPBCC domain-containing protein
MMFRRRFDLCAPLVAVSQSYGQPVSLVALTPLRRVQLDQAPDPVEPGSEIAFRLWLSPLGLRWRARIEAISPTGFVDRQIDGPFQLWLHRHTFRASGPEATSVLDEGRAVPRRHLLWGPVALGMWLSLPLLFAFRAWKARRQLERPR